MDEQEGNTNQTPREKPRKDRWIRLGFLAVVVVAVGAIYLVQRRGPALKGWNPGLNAALEQAGRENRRLLVFFMYSPPSEAARRMAATTLAQAQNRQAIEKGRFVRVKVPVSSLQSELARQYKLKSLPTMMVLDSDGIERNRREGFIGEVAFRRGFLDLSQIQKP